MTGKQWLLLSLLVSFTVISVAALLGVSPLTERVACFPRWPERMQETVARYDTTTTARWVCKSE